MSEYLSLFDRSINSESYALTMKIVDEQYKKYFDEYKNLLFLKRKLENEVALHKETSDAINLNTGRIKKNLKILLKTGALLTELRFFQSNSDENKSDTEENK